MIGLGGRAVPEGKVAVLYGRLPPDPSKDELDVLVEVRTVSDALKVLGYETVEVSLSLNLEEGAAALSDMAPSFVFNLVESLDGREKLLHLAPALLDSLKIPYTGASTEAMFLASNKLIAKSILMREHIPTPYLVYPEEPDRQEPEGRDRRPPPPYIIKPVWGSASIDLNDSSIIASCRAFEETKRGRQVELSAGELYIESFVEGRELNIAVLDGPSGPTLLPPSEILFVDYPPEKARIVGYEAKWDESSFEFSHTPRSFDFPVEDDLLIDGLKETALACWRLFDLSGYARFDFRVDREGRPWLLEINPNPCLSPDAGFMAAAARAKLDTTAVIGLIIEGMGSRGRSIKGRAGRQDGCGGEEKSR
ncbi:MAG TPA: D-alanine--D-alanine ligase [Spirochaetia bacterium]|nr:D-alanine--D-alanine ligase [Spirochaetia bacterium]